MGTGLASPSKTKHIHMPAAVPEIVRVLIAVAGQAQDARAGGENVPPLTRYMHRVSSLGIDWNDEAVVLTLECGPLPHRFLLTQAEWSQLKEAVQAPLASSPQVTH